MDRWNRRRPHPWPPEYWNQQSNSRDPWHPEFRDRQSIHSRGDQWPPDNWNQPPIHSRCYWSHGYQTQQSVVHRDQQSLEYVDQQPRDPGIWIQQPTFSSDVWLSNSRDRQSTYLMDPRFFIQQHPIFHKNSQSDELYPQAFETIRRPPWHQGSDEPMIGHSMYRSGPSYHPYGSFVLHEPSLEHSSYRNNFRNHPYGHRDQMSSHRRDSSKASVGSRANGIAVSVNTANSASTKTSNAANKKASKEQNKSLQFAKKGEKALQVAEKPKESLQVGNNDTTLEDVKYLYSVDPSEGRLVELVDLSENSQISVNKGLLGSESNDIPVNPNYEASDHTHCSTNTLLKNGKSDTQNTSKEQGECGDTSCNMCNKSYEELYNNNCNLYIARCGHLFCVLCMPNLKMKSKCIKCENGLSNFRKIFL